jgi:hypothetical protein
MSNYISIKWDKFVVEEQQRDLYLKNRAVLLSDPQYVTQVLGIQIPLTEAYPWSSTLTEQIIQEHLLVETFLSSVGDYLKEKGKKLIDPMKHFMQLLYKSLRDKSGLILNSFKVNLYTMIIRPLQIKLSELLSKFKLQKIYDWIKTNLIEPAIGGEGLRGLLNLAGLAVFLRRGFQAFGNLVEKIKDKLTPETPKFLQAIGEAAKEWLQNIIAEPWEKIKAAVAQVVDVKKWLEIVGPIVGSVATVVQMLHPAVKGLATAGGEDTEEEKEGYQHCYVKKICSTARPTKVGQKAGQFAGIVSPEQCAQHQKDCKDYTQKKATEFE